jgi:hypothetical protein
MAKTAEKTTTATKTNKAALTKTGGRKSTGETIDIDTPPKKKQSTVAARYSIKKEGFYTMNPYAHGLKNKIDIVLDEGGVPSKDAQPQVSLLLGSKALSIQWKRRRSSSLSFRPRRRASQETPPASWDTVIPCKR